MGIRVRELSVLLGALLGVLVLLALQTVAQGQSSSASVAGEPVDASDGTIYIAGELIVTYEEKATEATEDNAVEDVDGEVEDEIEALDAEVVEIPAIQDDAPGEAREQKLADAKQDLENAPGVEAVDYDYIRQTAEVDEPSEALIDDPYYYEQYGLDLPNFPQAWTKSNRGEDARVAIVDTGIFQEHEDFLYDDPDPTGGESKSKVILQRDFVDDDLIADDDNGHGTHVAGTVGAVTSNNKGIASGCPGCDLIIARALGGEEGTGSDSDIADAIVWSAQRGADVINLSLGGAGSSTVLRQAVDYAYARNAVVVAAAGNDGNSTINYPAGYSNVISVAATNEFDMRAKFSNTGGTIDVAAPGVGILSTYPGTDLESAYKFLDGTSMASPHVAALAALLVAQDLVDSNPGNRSNSQVRTLILKTAVDLGVAGRDSSYGMGRIDALRAVNRGAKPKFQ
jgi:thermitase